MRGTIEGFDKAGFAAWLKDRPAIIKDLAGKIPPWGLYRLKSSGHTVYPCSYSENGTLTVIISREYNDHLLFGERTVFGIDPGDLSKIAVN